MKPTLEINVPMGNGTRIEKWGLTTDDSCVVVLRHGDDGWKPWAAAWIPTYVAMHMSTLATMDATMRQSYDVAYSVMYPRVQAKEAEVAQSAGAIQ